MTTQATQSAENVKAVVTAASKKGGKKSETKTLKADKKVAKKTNDKVDRFGFRKGTKTSMAAEMYYNGGATTEDVVKELGHAHLNLFKKVGKAGYVQDFVYVKNAKGVEIKKYKLVKKGDKK